MAETPAATPPTQGNEDYEAKMKAWENQKQGLVRDLQGERDKRHALERELEETKAKLETPPEDTGVANAEVNLLAQNPKKYVDERAQKLVNKKLAEIERQRLFDKGYEWLAKQEGKDISEIVGSDLDKELVRISKEHGISMARPDVEMRALYKIHKYEQKQKELEEENRGNTITSQSTERVVTTPHQGKIRWTRELLRTISDEEYLKHADEIGELERKGLIPDK